MLRVLAHVREEGVAQMLEKKQKIYAANALPEPIDEEEEPAFKGDERFSELSLGGGVGPI